MRRIALKAFDFSRQLRRSPSNVKRLLATNSAINRAEKLSNEPNNIAAAFVDNDCRKLERICEEITSLNLLQVSALVMRLKTALNIPDEALNAQFITASASASSSTNSNIENSPSDNKELISVFDLTLKSFDPSNKLKLVKYFKDRMSMTLVEAKNFVEKVPQVVMSKISSEEADQMASCLAELGGEVTKTESK
ncbi:MAG: 54S ribosomal protein L12, mitochondrial [Marteilia pararefringens]